MQKMGSFRSKPDLKKHTEYNRGIDLQYVSTHMCGWRIYMQDSHITKSTLTDKKHSLFAVFDGYGGAEVSKFVERHFVQQLQESLNYKKGNYEVALRETFLRMDELIFSQQGRKEIVSIQKQMREIENGPKFKKKSDTGCTANVILITPEFIYCANAGDSRSVACIGGKMQQLSRDHKPYNPQQFNRITKAGGFVIRGRVNDRLQFSRGLGADKYKKNDSLPAEEQMITANPDISITKNENIDFIIMGCDGIWSIKSNQEMINWMQTRLENIKFEGICEYLLDELVSKDKDSITAILIKFNKKSQDQIKNPMQKSQDQIKNHMDTMKLRSLFLFLLLCIGLVLVLGNRDIN